MNKYLAYIFSFLCFYPYFSFSQTDTFSNGCSGFSLNSNVELFGCQEDNSASNIYSFHLDDKAFRNSFISTGNMTPYNVYFYYSSNDANSAPIPTIQDTFRAASQTLWARVEDAVNSCYEIISFKVVGKSLTSGIPNDLMACVDVGTNSSSYPLSGNDTLVTSSNSSLVISHHASVNGALNNTDILNTFSHPQTFNANFDPVTVSMRIEDALDPSCFKVLDYDLILNQKPSITTATIESCSSNTIGTFDLTQVNSLDASLNASDYNLQYFTSAGNIVSNPSTYVAANSSNAYIRTSHVNLTTCSQDLTITLNTIPKPDINTAPEDLYNCDTYDASGSFVGGDYDLTTNDTEILNGLTKSDYTFTYFIDYATAIEANTVSNVSSSVTQYRAVNSRHYETVRVTDNNNACFSLASFSLIASQKPSTGTPNTITMCDDRNDLKEDFDLTVNDALIKNNSTSTNLTVMYFEKESDANAATVVAGTEIQVPTAYEFTRTALQTESRETVYARLSDNISSSCFSVVGFDLVLKASPTLPTSGVSDLLACDSSSETGVVAFDLSTKDADVMADLTNTSDFTVTYYSDLTSARNNTVSNALNKTSHSNTNTLYNPETIYSRLEEISTGCFSTVDFKIQVNRLPDIDTSVGSINLCNTSGTGIQSFDLTQNQSDILTTSLGASLTPSDYTLSYFNSTNNTISTPTAHNNSNTTFLPETIFVDVLEQATACSKRSQFNIQVIDLPSATTPPINLEECDDDQTRIGFESFDFTSTTSGIVNGRSGLVVDYYNTLANANTGNTASSISNTNYENAVINSETIYARITDTATSCSEIYPFNISVTPLPTMGTMSNLVKCDNEGTGSVAFNFHTDKTNEILSPYAANMHSSYIISFYDNTGNASTAINQLSNTSYSLSTPSTVNIDARLEDGNTNCFSTATFSLSSNSPTSLNLSPSKIALCDTDENDKRAFDLDSKETDILNGVTDVVNFKYFIDDPTGTNPTEITSDIDSYENTTNPQTIFVEAVTPATFCTQIATFTIEVIDLPSLTTVSNIELCETSTPADNFESFDLSATETTIISGLSSSHSATFYSSESGAILGASPGNANYITSPYTNTTAGNQTIWARLDDSSTGCFKYTSFDLRVNPLPDLGVITPLVSCDTDKNGTEVFTLGSTQKNEILSNQIAAGTDADYSVTFTDSTGTQTTSETVSNGSSIMITATVQNINTSCSDSNTFSITGHALPAINTSPGNLEKCDTNEKVTQNFNIASNEAAIKGTYSGTLVYSYYLTLSDAERDESRITTNLSDYTSSTSTKTIYARAEDTATGCFDIASFDLIINSLPDIPSIDPLYLCNTGTTLGFEEFDLSGVDTDIKTALPSNTVTLHETEASASTGGASTINAPYTFTNTVANKQSLYVRVEDPSNGCASYDPFDIIVDPLPNIGVVSDLEACDLNGDAKEFFILGDQDTDILNGLSASSYDVTYYTSSSDANYDADNTVVSSIPTPLSKISFENTSQNQSIYGRLQNITTKCHSNVDFKLLIHSLPDITTSVSNIEACLNSSVLNHEYDLTSKILDILKTPSGIALTVSDYTLTYHLSQSDADSNQNAISDPSKYRTSSTRTIYVRVEDKTTGCYEIATFMTVLSYNPAPSTTLNLQECSSTTAGYTEFDLTNNTGNIQGSLNPSTNLVSYYKTSSNADSKTADILDSTQFTNTIKDSQTIYYRFEDSNTGCYTTGSFSITVDPLPTVAAISSYELCDGFGNAPLTSTFDLTTKDIEILQNAVGTSASYDIEYYQNNGATKTLITDPKTYSSTDTLIDYDIINKTTSCSSSGQFNLVVNPRPSLYSQADFIQCEESDGKSTFDLTTRRTSLIGANVGSFTVYFYQSEADASNTTRQATISNPSAYLGSNTEMIYTRIENDGTGCYSVNRIELIVNALPNNPTVTNMELCNVNAATQLPFDLSTKNTEILGSNPSAFLVTYYKTLSDAEAGTSAISSPYTSSGETIYTRTEDNTTGCFVTNSFDLELNTLPKTTTLQDLESCEDPTSTGLATFDFSNQSNSLLLVNSGVDVTVSFYLSQSDADTGTGTQITNTTSYMSAPRTIYARVEDTNTNCYDTTTFDITLNVNPTVSTSIATYEICGDDTGNAYFNLDTKNSEVLGTYSSTDYSVIYYETKSDAEAKTDPIASSNDYYSSGNKSVYARLENKTTNCFNTASFPLEVNAKPNAGIPSKIVECSTGLDTSEFDLTSKYDEIKINSVPKLDYGVIYYPSLATAQNRTLGTEISTSTYSSYTSTSKTIYANLINNKTDCFDTTLLELEVVDSIKTQVLSNIESCDDATGRPTFDLTSRNAVIEGLNPNDTLVFTFFESVTDLNSNTNAISNHLAYRASDGKKMYIKIEKESVTGITCPTNIDVDLQVNPLPSISSLNTLPLCDDDFDAKATFDITTSESTILNGLNKALFPISYHNSEDDANNNANLISSPSDYESEGETVYARVEDSATGCFIIEPFDLVVNETPNISSLTYEVCDDDNDGFSQFDLTKMSNDLLLSLDTKYSYGISYHFSLSEAQKTPKGLELNDPFTNTIPFSQVIYYRVENTTNECLNVESLTVNALQLPTISNPIDYYQCDDSIKDGFSIFNLNEVKELVDEKNEYKDIRFYETSSDLISEIDIKGDTFNNTTQNFQYIFATVEDSKGCVSKGIQVSLHVNSQSIASSPTELLYQVCDDTIDGDSKNGITEFDFSDAESRIKALLPVGNHQISFYNTEIESLKKENPILNRSSFRNTLSPGKQTIFVRIENGSAACQYLEGAVVLETITIPNLLLTSDVMALCKNRAKPEIGIDLGDAYSYEWNTGESTPMLSVNTKGDYFLKVTEKANNCIAFSNTLSFTESESANIGEINIDGEFTDDNKKVTVEILNEGDFEYQLDESDYQVSNIFSNVSVGKHLISVRDKKGCGVSSKPFDVLAFSKYFTPNGDGYNDTWSIVDVGSIPEVKIFDRFGNYIITLNGNFSEWDGKICGIELPASDYWYELNYVDKDNEVVNLKGSFTLKR